MKIAIMSDIHGNITALKAVCTYLENTAVDAIVLLGDLIDYCPHSNEVIQTISELQLPIICNIWGNHEDAVMNNHYERFSSERGRVIAKHTQSQLNKYSIQYISEKMVKEGCYTFDIEGKKCLAVHGSLEDNYWKSVDYTKNLEVYEEYDYVFTGHSHYPHFFEKFFCTDDIKRRNRKKTIFINPGSVGQPRNLIAMSQFAIADTATETVSLIKVPYDIKKEQQDFTEDVDIFYKERLDIGV